MRPDSLSPPAAAAGATSARAEALPLPPLSPPRAGAAAGLPRHAALSLAGSLHRELGVDNQDAFAAGAGGAAYAVADGHGPGGRAAARTAADALVAAAHLGLHEAFRRAANAVDAVPGADDSGATATLVILHRDTRIVEVGNVGDSDAICISSGVGTSSPLIVTKIHDIGHSNQNNGNCGKQRQQQQPQQHRLEQQSVRRLTVQHRPSNEAERARVLACGALVDNGYVVDGPEPNKMISITRSFGDKDVRALGIISKPDCSTVRLSDDDRYLVLATDGLWDAHGGDLTMERISEAVLQYGTEEGCHHLIELAAGSSTHPIDDCTVLIVPLDRPQQQFECSQVDVFPTSAHPRQ
jgi:serine/threonine protein phosphatase PrpC